MAVQSKGVKKEEKKKRRKKKKESGSGIPTSWTGARNLALIAQVFRIAKGSLTTQLKLTESCSQKIYMYMYN